MATATEKQIKPEKDLSRLQQAIEKAMDTAGSQNALAKKLGVSAATLVNIRQGNWDLLSNEMINKLKSKFRVDDWPLKQTFNFKAIQNLCEDARINHKFYAIAGYSGAGKTTALRFFAEQYRNVYYIHGTAITNKRTFLLAIQQAMGISKGILIPQMMDAIIEHMNSHDYPLLIIDDAAKLNITVLQLIQIIYDATEGSAGLVLAGTQYLKENIERLARKNKMGFQELCRRIAYWQPMIDPDFKMVDHICNSHGVTDPDAIKWIHENANNYGSIRNIIETAIKTHNEKDLPIDRALLENLHIGQHHYNRWLHPRKKVAS
jgi:DNA transposition AAA+ family ATPase